MAEGEIKDGKRINLSSGKFALVDNEDYWFLRRFKWYFDGNYAYMQRSGKNIAMHRLITMVSDGFVIDHKNRDKLDNRKDNLRICSHRDNNRNCMTKKTGYFLYKGVGQSTGSKRFYARIRVDKKPLYLGSYPTQEDAAMAYDAAAVKYFGEFAKLNFEHPASKGIDLDA